MRGSAGSMIESMDDDTMSPSMHERRRSYATFRRWRVGRGGGEEESARRRGGPGVGWVGAGRLAGVGGDRIRRRDVMVGGDTGGPLGQRAVGRPRQIETDAAQRELRPRGGPQGPQGRENGTHAGG